MKEEKRFRESSSNDDKMWHIWGIPIFGGKRDELLRKINYQLSIKNYELKKELYWVVTVNPEHVMLAVKDTGYFKLLQESSLNVVDGVGLIWAKYTLRLNYQLSIINYQLIKKIYWGFRIGIDILKGEYRDEVVAGSSLMADLAKMAAEKKYKIFYLGGFGDRAERTAKYFKSTPNPSFEERRGVSWPVSLFPQRGIKGDLAVDWSPGEPQITNEEVIKKIIKAKPEILLVAYGMKKQEEWIQRNFEELEKAGVRLVMGVGRSFDYYSGDLKRAPEAWRKMGLEWLYSLIQEPRRWRRQLALVKFVARVMNGR